MSKQEEMEVARRPWPMFLAEAEKLLRAFARRSRISGRMTLVRDEKLRGDCLGMTLTWTRRGVKPASVRRTVTSLEAESVDAASVLRDMSGALFFGADLSEAD